MPLTSITFLKKAATFYTNGMTSSPKGVVYNHRGAYLSTLSLVLDWEMGTPSLPVDPTHVPLQRLDLHLGSGRA